MGSIIGIDLGTTNSVAAYLKNGHPVIVPNQEGDALTPSVVAFAEDDRRWVGRIAYSDGSLRYSFREPLADSIRRQPWRP